VNGRGSVSKLPLAILRVAGPRARGYSVKGPLRSENVQKEKRRGRPIIERKRLRPAERMRQRRGKRQDFHVNRKGKFKEIWERKGFGSRANFSDRGKGGRRQEQRAGGKKKLKCLRRGCKKTGNSKL